MADLERIVELLGATAEVCGAEIKPNALIVMAQDLSAYPMPQIESALARVRREVTGRFTLAAVMERLAANDGRPGADEAWSLALAADDENETVVWTQEMAQAFFAAQPVLQAGDKVGARMAFKSAYERLVADARASSTLPKWEVSIGHDKERREAALTKAVTAGLLTHEATKHYLPAPQAQEGNAIGGLLTGKVIETSNESFNERLAKVRELIKSVPGPDWRQKQADEEARNKWKVQESMEQWGRRK